MNLPEIKQIKLFDGQLFSKGALMQADREQTRLMVGNFHGGDIVTMEGFVSLKSNPFCGSIAYIDDKTGEGWIVDYEWVPTDDPKRGRIVSVFIQRDPSYDADPIEQAPLDEDEQGWREDFHLVVNFVRELAEAAERGGTSYDKVQAFAYERVYAFMSGIAGERGITLPEIQIPENN